MDKNDRARLYIYAENGGDNEKAAKTATHLNAEIIADESFPADNDLVLRYGENGLMLTCGGNAVMGDFTHMIRRIKPPNLSGELLVRAARFKNTDRPLTAVDATAGLGEDSLLLAAAGFKVTLFEYDPLIAALLFDAMERAMKIPELQKAVSNMTLFEENSIEKMPLLSPPDLIYLDPMFPDNGKSALSKKKFQILHRFKPPCIDGDALVAAAMKCSPCKIIIKRPIKGAYLANMKPSFSLSGKAVRYDCLVFPQNYAAKKP